MKSVKDMSGSKSYTGDVSFYRIDGHGSVTAVLSPTGEELKSYSYDAYGAKKAFIIPPMGESTILYQWKAETDGIHNPFGYCGEYTDAETGLIYLRNRYYNPTIGRFITEDPIRDGLNWYAYANNNPVMFVDPWGLIDVPLRTHVESLGGTVTWNARTQSATVSFGSAGSKTYYVGEYRPKRYDTSSSENPYLKYVVEDGNVTMRMYINDQDIINDFGVLDSINRYSAEFSAYVSFTLFEKNNKTYQRFVINYQEIEYKKVNYNSFNYYIPTQYTACRYNVGIGPVTDNTRYWINGEWKNSIGDILSTAGEVTAGVKDWSDYASLGGNIIGMQDWSKTKLHIGDVHIGFGKTHYYLNPKGWVLRDV